MAFIRESKNKVGNEQEDPMPDLQLNTHDEVHEILGNPPGWTLRWGVGLIFLIMIIGVSIAAFISYPDIVNAPVYLTTENPPIEIVTKQEGKINALLVKDQQYVQADALLATIENPASYGDVLEMEVFIEDIKSSIGEWSNFDELDIPDDLDVGQMNTLFSELTQSTRDLQYYLSQHAVFKQIKSIEREIKEIKKLNRSLDRQNEMYKEELDLLNKNYERNIQLNKKDIVSDVVLENIESEYRAARREYEKMKAGIIDNNIRVEQLNTRKQLLKSDRADGVSDKSLTLLQLIDRIKSSIDEWKLNYLITSPIAGTINFENYRNKNQYIPAATAIFTVVPDSATHQIIARSQVPIKGSGKIMEGAKVNIRLAGFPYREYGVLTTRIDKIASLPFTNQQTGPSYEMLMYLPDSLVTTYDVAVPFKHNMSGTARIITKDRSFLTRIFEQFLNALYN